MSYKQLRNHTWNKDHLSSVCIMIMFSCDSYLCLIQLQAVNWRLNLQMAQCNMTKMKLPNAMFELSLASGTQVKFLLFQTEKSMLWFHLQVQVFFIFLMKQLSMMKKVNKYVVVRWSFRHHQTTFFKCCQVRLIRHSNTYLLMRLVWN